MFAMIQGLNMPSRMAIVSDLVSQNDLMNGFALNSAVTNAGRTLGPGLAGGLIAVWDIGPALLLNGTCSLMAACFLLVVASTSRPSRDAETTILCDLGQGIQYCLGSSVALTVIGMRFALRFFGIPYIQVLPAFIRESL